MLMYTFSEPLSITCPSDLEVTAPDQAGATVTYPQPTHTGGFQPSSITCYPSSGSLFGISQNAHSVTCTVIDAQSNTKTCSFSIQVKGKLAFFCWYFFVLAMIRVHL